MRQYRILVSYWPAVGAEPERTAYTPQYRGWFGWREFDANTNPYVFRLVTYWTLDEARRFLDDQWQTDRGPTETVIPYPAQPDERAKETT